MAFVAKGLAKCFEYGFNSSQFVVFLDATCFMWVQKEEVRQFSLPRLELLAVVIGTRVTMFVSNELKGCA